MEKQTHKAIARVPLTEEVGPELAGSKAVVLRSRADAYDLAIRYLAREVAGIKGGLRPHQREKFVTFPIQRQDDDEHVVLVLEMEW